MSKNLKQEKGMFGKRKFRILFSLLRHALIFIIYSYPNLHCVESCRIVVRSSTI